MGRPDENVVNDAFAACMLEVVLDEDVIRDGDIDASVIQLVLIAECVVEQGVPFSREVLHHASIKSGGVCRPEGHDFERVLSMVWCKEGKFLPIFLFHSDLVVSLLRVDSDKEDSRTANVEDVDCVVASRNRVGEWERYSIQSSVRNTHPPYEIVDVCDLFLMGFRGEDNDAPPWPVTLFDPVVFQEVLDLLHDNLGFVRPVLCLFCTDWLRTAGVDAKFVT